MTTETANTITPAALRQNFIDAMVDLGDTTHRFQAGELKSVPHAREREAAIAKGLLALAGMHGVTLKAPLNINSNGEFNIVAVKPGGHWQDNGHYGTFAAVLNPHRPRCGVVASAVLTEEASWCWMNHFDAEEMVRAEYTRLT